MTSRLIVTVGTHSVELNTYDGRTSIHLATERFSSPSARTILAATDRVVAEHRPTVDSVTIRCTDARMLDDISAAMGASGLGTHGGRPVKLELVEGPALHAPPRQDRPPAGHVPARHRGAVPQNKGTTRRRLIGVGGVALTGAAISGYLLGNGSDADHPGSTSATHDPGSPATVSVDELGSTDEERIARLNDLARRSAGKNSPVYEFANRIYTISTPIQLFSGLKLRGTGGLSAREYDGGTVIAWKGEDDSSVFAFPPEGQSGQNYPADGSPRDISISGLLFEGGASTNVFPRLSMSPDSYVGKTLWYSSLHNLGVRAMRTFWWGYGTGVSISGSFHAQAMTDTPLYLGGSENTIFGTADQSFMDNSSASWRQSGKAFIRSVMSKSYIGRVIITARSDSFHLSIEGGRGLVVDGVQFDAPASDQSRNAAIKVSGIDGLTLTNCVFYGSMSQPGDSSRGIVDISGGRGIVITGNQFVRRLGDVEADSLAVGPGTPLIYNAASDPVKLGMNAFSDYDGVVIGNAITSDPTFKLQRL